MPRSIEQVEQNDKWRYQAARGVENRSRLRHGMACAGPGLAPSSLVSFVCSFAAVNFVCSSAAVCFVPTNLTKEETSTRPRPAANCLFVALHAIQLKMVIWILERELPNWPFFSIQGSESVAQLLNGLASKGCSKRPAPAVNTFLSWDLFYSFEKILWPC